VEQGVARIIVLGGDGTIHEAANGLLRARVSERPPISVVPAGTGNDFAKLCGTVGRNPHDAVGLLARGAVRRLDVGEGWGEFFLNSIGIGFDAEVAHRLTLLKHGRGLPAYLITVLRTLTSREPFEAVVDAGSDSFAARLLLLEVGNGPVVGGGFRITPEARPDDGLLDVCAIQDMPLHRILVRLPLVMLGRHLGLREVRHFRCERLVVRQKVGAVRAQLDGEIRARAEPLEIQVHPGALPVLFAQS
jgi:diacylglycerol kinase (ATP)